MLNLSKGVYLSLPKLLLVIGYVYTMFLLYSACVSYKYMSMSNLLNDGMCELNQLRNGRTTIKY